MKTALACLLTVLYVLALIVAGAVGIAAIVAALVLVIAAILVVSVVGSFFFIALGATGGLALALRSGIKRLAESRKN